MHLIIKKMTSALTALAFILILAGGLAGQLLTRPPATLSSERRPPATFPKADSLWDGTWMNKFEKYAADRNPLREPLRALRAFTVLEIFRQSDKDGLYIYRGGAGKFEPLNAASARMCTAKIAKVCEALGGLALYYAVVPDKSYYAGRGFPGYDPAKLRGIFSQALPGLVEIDLTGALAFEDYYRTDLHWDQPKLGRVLDALSAAMDFPHRFETDFFARPARTPITPDGTFGGVYVGQLALPLSPDNLAYMSSAVIDAASAQYLTTSGEMAPGPIYDLDRTGVVPPNDRDPYSIFLGGPQPLVVLDNPSAETDKELYLFRDSFASSLAPLLIPSYRRITLIDLRYIYLGTLAEYVIFQPGADVLFLYSSQIVNSADVLKV